MNWQDTVLNERDLLKLCISFPQSMDVAKTCALNAQAKVSYEVGIREVVEWLERARKQKVPKYQLEEWGIE